MPDGDKTEDPTGKRLDEAHDRGQFARSPEVNVVFVLAAAFGTLIFTMREQTQRVAEIAVNIFSHLGSYTIKADNISEWVNIAIGNALPLAMPMGLACAAAAVAAGGAQSRFRFTPNVIELNFKKIDPTAGLQRLFSGRSGVQLCTDAVKLSAVGGVIWGAAQKILSDPLFFTPVPVARLGTFMQETATSLLSRFIMVLGGLAAANYIYQVRKTTQELRMTKQELKDEARNSDGDPAVKGALRNMARRLMQKQMLSAVPNADVVVTNPTHFAVALKYERGRDKAPVVLAKGSQLFARRIKEIASENEVPMIENKPVARMLFKYGQVGKPIPMELYRAVAEILAFVYKTHRYYFHALKIRRSLVKDEV